MFTAAEYNALPTVGVADTHAGPLSEVRHALIELISRYDLGDQFAVRLLHRHFDMNENEVAVFRFLTVPDVAEAIIMGPLPVANISQFKPKNFGIKDGILQPYEWTTGPGLSLVDHVDFATEYAQILVDGNATNVFGLMAMPRESSVALYEFEVPDIRTTVMVPEHLMPTAPEGSKDIDTNWLVEQLGSAQPTTRAHCRQTGTKHSSVRSHCRSTGTKHSTVQRWVLQDDAENSSLIEQLGSAQVTTRAHCRQTGTKHSSVRSHCRSTGTKHSTVQKWVLDDDAENTPLNKLLDYVYDACDVAN